MPEKKNGGEKKGQFGPQGVWRAILVGRAPSGASVLSSSVRQLLNVISQPQIVAEKILPKASRTGFCSSLPAFTKASLLNFPRSKTRFRDPLGKSDSINQILTQHGGGGPSQPAAC